MKTSATEGTDSGSDTVFAQLRGVSGWGPAYGFGVSTRLLRNLLDERSPRAAQPARPQRTVTTSLRSRHRNHRSPTRRRRPAL